MAAVLSVIVMGTYAEAAEITVSESRIELDKAQTEFSFELDIEEDELFAGAEFGITLPEGMTLSSVEYLDDEIKNAAHTPVVVKNGRAYFGFYSSENVFSGAYNAARLTFEYEGDADTEITLDSSQVVYVDDDGTTSGDTSSAPFTVEILRADENGGTGSNGNGSSGGSGGGGGGVSYYTVTFDTMGGSAVDSERVRANGTIEEPEQPVRDGYEFGGWYTDSECTESFDFSSKITKSMTLYAKWSEADDAETGGREEWVNPFSDVSESDWFYDAVRYANMNGLFGGVSETVFAPDMSITRGMMVTVLYRAEGGPEAGVCAFSDVPGDAYYADAVAWAEANGIVKGYSETEFGPDDNITREQIAAIMHRYAGFKGVDGDTAGDLGAFSDADKISGWAEEDMRWAVGTGLINGRGESIDPLGLATRSETAAVLQRFIEGTE